nr:immunoglobulin light chain junction region [Macaca mulatta]
CQQYNGVPLTF